MANQDFIAECNNLHVSTEEFCSVWCPRCANSECTRSAVGKGGFDARVRTWEERLFKNPPKLPETDPRFELINAKMFQEVPVGQISVVHGWDVESRGEGAEQTTSIIIPAVPSVAPQITEVPQKPVSTAVLGNTPNQSGQMVGGTNETIIKPGTDTKAIDRVMPYCRVAQC